MSIQNELFAEAEKHKGTDLGGLLQVAAYLIEDYIEELAEKDREIEGMLADCKRMHQGLIDIDNNATAVSAIAFGAMPNRKYIVEEVPKKKRVGKK